MCVCRLPRGTHVPRDAPKGRGVIEYILAILHRHHLQVMIVAIDDTGTDRIDEVQGVHGDECVSVRYVCQSAWKSQNCTLLGKNIFPLQKCFQMSYCVIFKTIETIFSVTLKFP